MGSDLLQSRFRSGLPTRVAALGAIVVGGLVLLGWATGIESLKRVAPGLVAMNPATALLFVFCGASLWLQRAPPGLPKPNARARGGRLLAALVASAALLKLVGLGAGWHPGIDEWLFPSRLAGALDTQPNRMAPNTACAFLLLGLALATLEVTTRHGRRPAEILASLVFMLALLAPVGYAYGIPVFAGWAHYIPMALPTAATFMALSAGVFLARPGVGMMAVIGSASPGGLMLRRLYPAIVLALLGMGWLRLEGERRGYYGMELGVALYTIANVMVVGLLVWGSAHSLHRAALRRRVDEERLRLSEERTQAIIETASDAFVAMDADGVVFGWNRQAETIFGWARSEVVGKVLAEVIIPPQHRAAHAAGMRRFAASGEGRMLGTRTETTALRRDGAEFPVEVAIWPVHASGSYTFNAFIRDIGERVKAQAALLEAGQQLRQTLAFNRLIMDNSPDVICAIDSDGRFVEVSAASEKLWGYPPSELVGRPYADLVHADDRERTAEAARSIRAGGAVVGFNNRYTARSGEGVEVDWSAVWSDRDALMFCVARDATARKHAEDAIRALNDELRANAEQLRETNRELEAFSYTISHDLRAPLRHIDGYAGMLQEDAGDQLDAEMRRYLDAIGVAARQMGALIDDLLAFSRLGRKPVERSLVDMGLLVERARLDVGANALGGAQIAVGTLPAACADAALLKQVWINLLSNAVKYSAPRGADARIEVSGERVGDRLRYQVRDNGVGFDMRYADKLFGVFQRMHAQDEFEGTGVGLAIVQRIVTRHGGTVAADSTPGRGATFTFDLPAGEEARPPVPEPEAMG